MKSVSRVPFAFTPEIFVNLYKYLISVGRAIKESNQSIIDQFSSQMTTAFIQYFVDIIDQLPRRKVNWEYFEFLCDEHELPKPKKAIVLDDNNKPLYEIFHYVRRGLRVTEEEKIYTEFYYVAQGLPILSVNEFSFMIRKFSVPFKGMMRSPTDERVNLFLDELSSSNSTLQFVLLQIMSQCMIRPEFESTKAKLHRSRRTDTDSRSSFKRGLRLQKYE